MTPILVVHGGAGRIAPEHFEEADAGIRAAAEVGVAVLARGGSAVDAVVDAVRHLEDAPTFNAGRGSCMNRDGGFEMDAGIMRSSDLRSGAVAAVPDAADPILIARHLMEVGPHRLLAGAGAVRFAEQAKIGTFGRDRVWTAKAEARRTEALRGEIESRGQADTVGAVALDAAGILVAGCSTGGVLLKLPGRVGDSPLIGSGFYAAPDLGAATATGVGEAILTHVASYETLRRIASGTDPEIAAREVCDRVAAEDGVTCGIIVVTPDGRTGVAHRSADMSWARASVGGRLEHGLRRR